MTRRKFPTTESPVSAEDSSISYHVAADLSHYTGQTLVIGETVFLSDEGVDLLAGTSGNFDAVNAYSFIDADRNVIGGVYARDDSGQNIIGIQAVDEAGEGDDTFLYLHQQRRRIRHSQSRHRRPDRRPEQRHLHQP